MVPVPEPAPGVALLAPSLLAMASPHADLALGRRLLIGVGDREELELNDAGPVRNDVGYGPVALFALGLILDSAGLL